MPNPEQYLRLLQLAADWSDQSGVPHPSMLRRLCDWAMAGGFPDGAFVNAAGAPFRLLDIYFSCRVLLNNSSFDTSVYLDGSTMWSDRWGLSLLREVLVTKADVLAFCEKANTVPTASLVGSLRYWYLKRCRLHLAPPECSDAEQYAVLQHRRDTAQAGVNGLQHFIEQRRRISKDELERGELFDPPAIAWMQGEWSKRKDHALASIQRHNALHSGGDGRFEGDVERLEHEWLDLLADPAKPDPTRAGCADARRRPAAGPVSKQPRLVIRPSEGCALLDGELRQIPEQPLKLLCLLAERAKASGGYVTHREIDECLWGNSAGTVTRRPSDAVRDLRTALAGNGEMGRVRDLIENKSGHGYRLALDPDEIAIESA